MFTVSDAEAKAIRTAFLERGEWAAVVELRRLFPVFDDNAQALRCVRAIAGWQTPPTPPPSPPRRGRAGGGDAPESGESGNVRPFRRRKTAPSD